MARILIVDDRAVNRKFMTTLLGYERHELIEASDGVEALNLATEKHPDLIISDVLMPTMDGYEFVRRLREDPYLSKIPVVFSTAHYLSREARALAEKCGVSSVIYKPCEAQTVLDVVKTSLADKDSISPARAKADEFDRAHVEILTDQLSYKNEQLRDANGKLTALVELSTELAQECDPVRLLDRYCAVVREVVGARWALVALMERNLRAIQHLVAIGLELEDSPDFRERLLRSVLFATLLKDGRPISLSETTATAGSLLLDPLPPTESLLVTPLSTRGKVNGWICLAGKLGLDAFSEQDQRLATALATKMAVAYENALLYNDSLKYASELETEISGRARVEQRLSESQARLAGIIDSAMDSIITIDSDQRVLMFNEAAEKMFRCKAADVIGQPLDRFIPSRFRQSHRADIRKFGDTGVTVRTMGALRPISGVRSNGEEFPIEASISQIEVNGQKLYTVILRDVTDRQRAEENLRNSKQRLEQALVDLQKKTAEAAAMTQQLWQASKLATMGELAASVAHELNNPLATIALSTERLIEQMPNDSSRRKSLEIILQEVERMAGLVDNLLRFSRRSHRQVSTVDIREEITNSVEFVHYHLRSHKIEVAHGFPEMLPMIQADRQQLRQLFLNLLTNASDAMPRGGTITVRVSVTDSGENSAVQVNFSDTGEGMRPEHLEKLWEPFFTTKPEGKGSGLGLAICRRIVEEHGGTIAIESELGRGTSVQITFPANSERTRA